MGLALVKAGKSVTSAAPERSHSSRSSSGTRSRKPIPEAVPATFPKPRQQANGRPSRVYECEVRKRARAQVALKQSTLECSAAEGGLTPSLDDYAPVSIEQAGMFVARMRSLTAGEPKATSKERTSGWPTLPARRELDAALGTIIRAVLVMHVRERVRDEQFEEEFGYPRNLLLEV